MKVEVAFAAAITHKTVDGHFRVYGEYRTFQRDAVPHFPSKSFCKCHAGQCSGAVLDEIGFLLRGLGMNVTVDFKKSVGIDGKLCEKIGRILIDSAEPLTGIDGLHSRK